MHEHVFILDPGALASFGTHFGTSYWDEEARVAGAIAELRRLREAGIETIVDPTAYGLGRDIPRIQRVNEGVDLNIVVATGVYAFVELPGFLGYRTDDWIVDLFVHEIREGIGDTGVKAAFLKCAVDRHGLAGDVPRMLSLVAAAAVETDAPVMVHTYAATQTGLVALDALVREGVDPRRVVVAHAGDSNDLDYLRAIADTGASLGCDRFNIEHFNPDEERIQTLVALVEAGYIGPDPPRARRRDVPRLHGRKPAVRGRAPRLPAPLDADPAAAARRRGHAEADRRDARREPTALLRLIVGRCAGRGGGGLAQPR